MAAYDFSLVDGNLVAFAEYVSAEAQRFTGCGTVGLHLLQQYFNRNPDPGSYPSYTFKGVTSTRLAQPAGTQPPVHPGEEALAEFSVFVSEAAAAFTGYPHVGHHLLAKYLNSMLVYRESGNSTSAAVDAPSGSDSGSGLAPVRTHDVESGKWFLAPHSAMDTSGPGMSYPCNSM